jgi:hypothetical protein
MGDAASGGAVRLASAFGIRGYVSRQAGTDDLPDGVTLLTRFIERNLVDAAIEMSLEFTRSQIAHFFVKGIALVNRVYQSGDREMADIDVHVSPCSRAAALDVLRRLGYELLHDVEQGAPETMRSGVALARGTIGSGVDHVAVDLRWGLDPVDRLLPRNDTPVPNSVWRSLDLSGPIPVPSDAQHATLIVHHLVHHDMLHLRGLLDLCLLWERLESDAGGSMEALARELRVLRALRLLAHVLAQRFGLASPGVAACPADIRGRRALRMMEPVAWCTWAARAPEAEFVEVTASRIARRVVLADNLRSVATLVEDAILPPEAYLRWRWPSTRSLAAARLKHFGRVIGKSVGATVNRDSIAARIERS